MKKRGLLVLLAVGLLSLSFVSALGTMISMNVDKNLAPGDIWYLGGTRDNIFSLVYDSHTETTARFVLKNHGLEVDSKTMNIGESYGFLFEGSEFFSTTFLGFNGNSAQLRNNFVNSTLINSSAIPDLTLLLGGLGTEKKTLAVGESWDVLGGIGGYRIIAMSIDARADPRQVWFTLTKDCVRKDELIAENGKYANFTISGKAVLRVYIDSIFAGATTDMVQLRYVSIDKDTDVFNPSAELKRENWQCSGWSSCESSRQSRTCTDLNNCGGVYGRPVVNQNCTAPVACTEDWNCTNWGECIEGKKRRNCTDINTCGTRENKPLLIQNCSLSEGVQVGGENIIIKDIGENKTVLVIGQEGVKSNLNVTYKDSKVYVSTNSGMYEVKITPETARVHVPENMDVQEIEIDKYKLRAIYIFYGKVKARLFAIIPVSANVEVGVNVDDGKLAYMEKPWWAFLASGV